MKKSIFCLLVIIFCFSFGFSVSAIDYYDPAIYENAKVGSYAIEINAPDTIQCNKEFNVNGSIDLLSLNQSAYFYAPVPYYYITSEFISKVSLSIPEIGLYVEKDVLKQILSFNATSGVWYKNSTSYNYVFTIQIPVVKSGNYTLVVTSEILDYGSIALGFTKLTSIISQSKSIAVENLTPSTPASGFLLIPVFMSFMILIVIFRRKK